MKFTKILRTTALAASLATVLGLAMTPTPAAAAVNATGNTIFKVILQPVVILDYYQEIDLTIDSTALQTLVGTAGLAHSLSAISANASGTSLTANASLTGLGGNSLSNVNLDISNAWAVRSITTAGSSPGTTTVTVAFSSGSTATLTGVTDTTSKIGLSTPGTGTSTVSFSGSGLAPANAKFGDVSMTMDLSTAKSADTYAGATIVITATST